MDKLNPVIWFEIGVSDLERAKAFYQAVFGGEFKYIEMPGMGMYMFNGSNEYPGAAGSLIKSELNKPSENGTIVYFACQDAAVEQAKVEKAGGKIVLPKTSIGEFGYITLFIDTEGNKIGLHSMK